MSLNGLLKNSSLDIDSLIYDMSGYVLVKSLDSTYVSANKSLIKEYKLSTPDQIVGLTDATVPHPLAQISAFFLKLDKELFQTGNKLYGIYAFPFHGNLKPFVFNRFFLKNDQGKKVAIYSHCMESDDRQLMSAVRELATQEPNGHGQKAASYYMFNKDYPDCNLTSTKSSCLFYLIRKETRIDIARRLNLPLKAINSCCDNIFYQLNLHTSHDLIELAIEKDYFSIVPHAVFSQLTTPVVQGNILNSGKLVHTNYGLSDFTPREIDCIKLLLKGMRTKEMASKLNRSPRTIECYIIQLKQKMGCRDKVSLIIKLKDKFGERFKPPNQP